MPGLLRSGRIRRVVCRPRDRIFILKKRLLRRIRPQNNPNLPQRFRLLNRNFLLPNQLQRREK